MLIAGAVILVAAVAWVGVQLLRPVPPMALTASVTTVRVLPGVTPRPDWPGRAEAAVGLTGVGLLCAHGGSRPVPIASLAKILTAYVVLRGHPLPAGGPGPPMLCERGRMMVGGTEGNTLAGMCFTGPVTVIGSPVCGSGFMLAIEAGTAPATARDQTRSWLCGGKMEAADG